MSISKSIIPLAGLAASVRSGEAGNPASGPTAGPRHAVPDSEVIPRPRRRRFTPEYKRSIIDQADGAHDVGAVGALLRREGLYSSTRRTCPPGGGSDGRVNSMRLTPKKRGPKVIVSALLVENRKLLAANARPTKRLKNAELIIEVQKK